MTTPHTENTMGENAILNYLHSISSLHRPVLERETDACCFYCQGSFEVSEITLWTDQGQTALCPLCGIDSVLPGTLEPALIEEMYEYYFLK